MKKIILITICVVSLLSVISCKKYPDGPKLSVVPKKVRLANRWKIESISVNGNPLNISGIFLDRENFTYDGDYFGNFAPSGNGKWEFSQDKKQVIITDSQTSAIQKLNVTKLEENALWFYIEDGGFKYEYRWISVDKHAFPGVE